VTAALTLKHKTAYRQSVPTYREAPQSYTAICDLLAGPFFLPLERGKFNDLVQKIHVDSLICSFIADRKSKGD
jgi:hypothetical protein